MGRTSSTNTSAVQAAHRAPQAARPGPDRLRYRQKLPLVLASVSPRREALLRAAGLQFEVMPSGADEEGIPARGPRRYAVLAALAKARAVAQHHPNAAVLAADTVVALDGEVLGKPASPEGAAAMLRRLRGRWHRVTTGVAVIAPDASGRPQERTAAVTTRVLMRPYTDEEIAAYVATGDPLDKAGAYAIQNAQFRPVERIRGSYPNVVGLPVRTALRLLEEAGAIERVTPQKAGASPGPPAPVPAGPGAADRNPPPPPRGR
jgi:MAF protein